MSKGQNELSWGQALGKFIGVMVAVFAIVVLGKLTMWIPLILGLVYLVYVLVWERPSSE